MIKHIINTFVVIAACLGIAAFVMVLIPKQNCQTKEPYDGKLPEMKMQVGTTNGDQCWGTCHLESPPAGVVARFCKNPDCTDCKNKQNDETWDVGVGCDQSAVDHWEHTGRCIAAPAGGQEWQGGAKGHYGDGYVCWTPFLYNK